MNGERRKSGEGRGRTPGGPAKVLHVEVGGSYGGSFRALELYLKHCDRSTAIHDLLLYYPTPGAERLRPLTQSLHFLYDRPPASAEELGLGRRAARRLSRAAQRTRLPLSGLREWLHLGLQLPTVYRTWTFLSQHKYDVLHVNNTFTYQPATILAAKLHALPVISHVRNPIARTSLNRCLLRLIRCVAVVNSSTTKFLRSWDTDARIEICYDGVEQPHPDPRVVSELRRSLAAQDETLVGGLGRLAEQKGFHVLLRAARLVLSQEPKVRFAIAGEGPLRAALERETSVLGLTEKFAFIGFRSDPTNFIAALDVFISSSLWEGLGLALAEAMLLGKPVVATNLPATAELVGPQGVGRLVPPNDPGALAGETLKMIRRARAGKVAELEVAATRVRKLLSADASASRFDSLVGSLIDSAVSQRTALTSDLGALRGAPPARVPLSNGKPEVGR